MYFSIVLDEMSNSKGVSLETRKYLATKAFLYISHYDNMIAEWFLKENEPNDYPKYFPLLAKLKYQLKYGENPHQKANFYISSGSDGAGITSAEQIQGKELSYNNIADTDAAIECVSNFEKPSCVIVKHANPCGVAESDNIYGAYDLAFKTDPTSAFGGIISFKQNFRY